MVVHEEAVEGVTLPPSWLSLDELTQRVGMSVRNVRFYASRGLVPPPVRRGRSGYYSADHVARLELVQDLQSHGFTLAAIEKYVAGIPASATPQDIALHRTMLAPWQTEPPVELSREELDKRAGRSLDADDLAVLTALGIVTPVARIERLDYEAGPYFSLYLRRVTGGARIDMPGCFTGQINVIHQPAGLAAGRRNVMDAGITCSVRR